MFSSAGSTILLLIGLSLVIFIHELGHYAVAKWVGIKVEQFAIGFGSAAISWRKGLGWRRGSSTKEYEQRLADGTPDSQLGETEYRINWLPLGGYVKMLGQEDLDMSATTADPRSFSSKSISARMAVISAGVIMNVIFAIILFIIAFLWGVDYQSSIIGSIRENSPAALAVPVDALQNGITATGLQPGDQILSIDDKPVNSYPKIRMAAAMAKPDQVLDLVVLRDDTELKFTITPEADPYDGLLGFGVFPTMSNTLITPKDEAQKAAFQNALVSADIGNLNIQPGMTLSAVNGQPINSLWQFSRAIDKSKGDPLTLEFTDDQSQSINATITPKPDMMFGELDEYQINHILGLCPPTTISSIAPGSNAEKAGLTEGDLIVRVGTEYWPQYHEIPNLIEQADGDTIEIAVTQNGQRKTCSVKITRQGAVGFTISPDLTHPTVSHVLNDDGRTLTASSTDEPSPPYSANALDLIPGSQLVSVNGRPTSTWAEFQVALLDFTDTDAPQSTVTLEIKQPTMDRPCEVQTWSIPQHEVTMLHNLGWHSDISIGLFEESMYTRRAENPIHAMTMGFTETRDMLIMTYLTIDRLFRGTVKVTHLKGPIGIVELGARAASRGFAYLIVFLGIISVNLAVLNFLPIPIVDGGLFLFLIIEKLKGSPVSERIQIAATYVGLCLIGAIFLVTFYNDISNIIQSILS